MQTTRLVVLMFLLGVMVLVNIYFFYTIIIPSFSKVQPDPSRPPLPSSPPYTPYPSPPPYYGIPDQRVPVAQRKFKSQAIDDFITLKATTMTDKDLVTLLSNCFPNTLDTTIDWYDIAYPHTFLITGDIPAMWIRDSTNQILPYMPFATQDSRLQALILGVIKTQAEYLYYDPYANAFLRPWYATKAAHTDSTPPLVGRLRDRVVPQYDARYVWESKYELDSLGHFFQLANSYMATTGDMESVLGNKRWIQAVRRIFQVIHDQQKGTWQMAAQHAKTHSNHPNQSKNKIQFPFFNNDSTTATSLNAPLPLPLEQGYRFTRMTDRPTETLGADGLGGIGQACGLVRSAFRPSDDATTFPYLIPANAQLSVQLKQLAQHIRLMGTSERALVDIATEAQMLGDAIHQAIYRHGVVNHGVYGDIFAYEVDCYGSVLLMDDANTPSLLALPLLGFVERSDPMYQRTRAFLLSPANPWFFKGKFGQGIGGPHTGHAMIWPISLLVQIQTSTDPDEVRALLDVLKRLAANATNGWMVESFHMDHPDIFTRPWFSWANGLLGATLADVDARFPHLL
ncbi:hypothetical protein BCR42DRAFT_458151 [Absidia repens]|uniref:Six-hairpin glycosidase-like protein n=1 Tax=Absidia repens TaxID=90262 RepID=A0A1X2J2Y2_9FUNG|nr:hypothetical protein BCR42DRAFT_458151 [Absidia repens]